MFSGLSTTRLVKAPNQGGLEKENRQSVVNPTISLIPEDDPSFDEHLLQLFDLVPLRELGKGLAGLAPCLVSREHTLQ